MPRLTRYQALEHASPRIIEVVKDQGARVLRLLDLRIIFDEHRSGWLLPKVTRFSDFSDFLTEKGVIQAVPVKLGLRESPRFIIGSVSPAEIVISLRDQSYLTHYTALYFHELTNNIPKTIYSNLEQTIKPSFGKASMTQRTIDLAFSRAMRMTNYIAQFKLDGEVFQGYLLNGQFQNRLGVTEIDYEKRKLPITTMERTLIDITVRPAYAGGAQEVLSAFLFAREKISVNTILATLKGMKFVYPYHQAIGFYLERAGYKESVLKLVETLPKDFDFYLTYQIKNTKYSERWKLYYPAELD